MRSPGRVRISTPAATAALAALASKSLAATILGAIDLVPLAHNPGTGYHICQPFLEGVTPSREQGEILPELFGKGCSKWPRDDRLRRSRVPIRTGHRQP